MMWTTNELMEMWQTCQVKLNGFYVPAKPVNCNKEFQSFFFRLKKAWLVFNCKADVFVWPEDEVKHE